MLLESGLIFIRTASSLTVDKNFNNKKLPAMANPENNTKNADEEFDLSKEFYKTRVHPTFCALPAENVKTRPSYSSHHLLNYSETLSRKKPTWCCHDLEVSCSLDASCAARAYNSTSATITNCLSNCPIFLKIFFQFATLTLVDVIF